MECAHKNVKRSSKSRYFLRDMEDQTLPKINVQPGITSLPNELLLIIFSYLPVFDLVKTVMPVNKHWYGIARHPLLWRHLELKSDCVMKIKGFPLLRMSPLLKTLAIYNRSDNEELLNQICKTNRSIEELSVCRCPCPFHYPQTHGAVNRCCHPYRCENQEICSRGIIRASIAVKVLKQCQELKSLQLVSVRIHSNKFFYSLGSLKHLTKLYIAHCLSLTPSNLQAIIDSCKSIQKFTLLGVKVISIQRNIKWIVAYRNLFKQWGSSLTQLELTVEPIPDTVLEDVSHCSTLKKLWLDFTFTIHYKVIKSISNLNKLEDLYLGNCKMLNFMTLQDMLAPGHLKHLKVLGLRSCQYVTNACLEFIAKSCPCLEKMDLSKNSGISDLGLTYLFEHCPNLHELNVYRMPVVKGTFLIDISGARKQLKFIFEKRCFEEKEKYINGLIRRFPDTIIQRH